MKKIAIMLILLVSGIAYGLENPDPAGKPLPKWAFTHVMGMMPATNWWGANNLFPLTEYGRKKPARYFTRIYGGQYRTLPLGFFYAFTDKEGKYNFNKNFTEPRGSEDGSLRPVYTRNPYRWDLEQAENMGIDGFALCLSGNEPSYKHAVNWFKTLEQMLQEKPDSKVRLTIAVCGNDLPNPEKPERYAWLKRFMQETRDSPAWLRHNNRIVFMGYHNMITWDAQEFVDKKYMSGAIAQNKEFLKSLDCGDPLFIFDGPEYAPGQITHRNINPQPELLGDIAALACQTFDGYTCWGGVIPDDIYPENYRIIADAVNAAGKAWMMPIVNLHSGIGQFYKSKPGIQRFLDTWKLADDTKAQMVQLVTWNDSNESTNFQPAVSLNYALSSLSAKFIYKFKHGVFPQDDQNAVYLFYRKYHPDANPYLYPRATVERDRDLWGENDDMLQVIVFAKDQGELAVTGTAKGTEKFPLHKGYNEFKLTSAVNQEIAARIYRDDKLVHELVSPERVTDRPYREDLIPWGWSSDCRPSYDRDFGPEFRPISYYSQRYNDGIPDWFRLHYFGTTEPGEGTRATDDPDGDGSDNLHEYLAGNDPLRADPPYPAGFQWDEIPKALAVIEDQPSSDRINLNPYPDKNGKLVHAFLYQHADGKLDGNYPFMMKWVNKVKGCKTGWSFRSGTKLKYFLTDDKGIGMDLLPGMAGIYGFCSPVGGLVQIKCRLVCDVSVPMQLYIKQGSKELFSGTCAPGKELSADLKVNVAFRDRIDFIVKAVDNKSSQVTLYPEITLNQ